MDSNLNKILHWIALTISVVLVALFSCSKQKPLEEEMTIMENFLVDIMKPYSGHQQKVILILTEHTSIHSG